MTRPTFFRDPIHVQLRFDNVSVTSPVPDDDSGLRSSWLLRKLIDAPEFQRLRFIRQNGLANLVFHGAEHSRFVHSMGVSHLAHQMYDRVVRNMGEAVDSETRLTVGAAALLHDIGHGPFSHTLEHILSALDVTFDHEVMTQRIIADPDTSVNRFLREIDDAFPEQVLGYIDKERREKDKWEYKLVSSQLDADRLDYLLRDAQCAGVRGHTFDLARLLDLLHHVEGKYIAVEEGGLEAVESYIVSLDQMYRAVYYHHAVRAASVVLQSCIARAVELYRDGDEEMFPDCMGHDHPLAKLVELGDAIELNKYLRLGEHHIWTLIEYWSKSMDPILQDLANRIYSRRLFKSTDFDPKNFNDASQLKDRARELAIGKLPHVTGETVNYYVSVDEPSRTSYKRYNFKPEESATESIWIMGDHRAPKPIEEEEGTRLIPALANAYHAHRLIYPGEIRDDLLT